MKESTIVNRFRKAGLLREESSAASEATFPRDTSTTGSDGETEKAPVCNENFLGLFNSDTVEDDFSGFRAQEEDE